MGIASITVHISSLSETSYSNFEWFVTQKLSGLYPDTSLRIKSHDGSTLVWVESDTGQRLSNTERFIREECVTDWWDEFCRLSEDERSRGDGRWRPEHTAKGY